MILAQGRYWRISLDKEAGAIGVEVLRDAPEDLRELLIEIPLDRWNRVLKHVRTDRKLLGGILLDFARPKALVSPAVSNDRLFNELQCVVVDATAALVEAGALSLTVVHVGAD